MPGATETAFASVVGFPFASKNAVADAEVKPILTWPLVSPLLGLLYWGWLNKLNASMRNLILILSVNRINFQNDKSTRATPVPRQSPTGAVPIEPNWKSSSVYRFGLIHWKLLEKWAARQGWPAMRLGRYCPLPRPIPERSLTPEPPAVKLLITGVYGVPLETLRMEPTSQFSSAPRAMRFQFGKFGVS